MTLSVVYAHATGHVLGALSTTGEQAPDDVGVLVGPALPMRVALGDGETATLSVRDRNLAALAADDEPGVFDDPFAFGVELLEGPDGTEVAKPTLLRLTSWSTELVLDDTGLTVTVPLANETRAVTVVALISVGADTRVLSGSIGVGKTSVTLPETVDTGPHGVLVLAAGWAARLESVTR